MTKSAQTLAIMGKTKQYVFPFFQKGGNGFRVVFALWLAMAARDVVFRLVVVVWNRFRIVVSAIFSPSSIRRHMKKVKPHERIALLDKEDVES